MLDIFKARLKAKAKALGANLSQTRIDAIADRLHKKNPDITEEADHDAKIDDLNDLQPFADIAKADDQIRTLSKKKETTSKDENPDDDPTKKDKPVGDENEPAWAKAIREDLQALKSEKAQTSNAVKLKEKLKDKKIPDAFLGKYTVDKEEDLDTVAATIETDFATLKQQMANDGFSQGTPPAGGTGVVKVSEKAFESAVDSFVADKKGPITTSTPK